MSKRRHNRPLPGQTNFVRPPAVDVATPPAGNWELVPLPDVVVIRPDAAAVVGATTAGTPGMLPPEAPDVPASFLTPQFSTNTFFTGDAGAYVFQKPVPSTDPFTLLVMATMARLSYVTNDDALSLLQDAFPDLSWGTSRGPGQSFVYDVWVDRYGRKIIVIPGTQTFKTWLGYLPCGMTTGPLLRGQWRAYAGLYVLMDTDTAALEAELAENLASRAPVVIVGHSAGGSLAQLLALRTMDAAYPAGWPSALPLMRALYTFGMPRTFWPNPDDDLHAVAANHVRVINSGDPVPDAPEVWATANALITQPVPFVPLILPDWYFFAHPPRHLARHTVLVDHPTPTVRINNARQAAVALSGSPFDLVSSLVNAHSLRSYCDNLERDCRNTGSFDRKLFPLVVAANRALTAQSH